jgi:hypothetical protein
MEMVLNKDIPYVQVIFLLIDDILAGYPTTRQMQVYLKCR